MTTTLKDIIALAAHPAGVSSTELFAVSGWKGRSTGGKLTKLVRDGILYRVSRHGVYRYFAHWEHAQACFLAAEADNYVESDDPLLTPTRIFTPAGAACKVPSGAIPSVFALAGKSAPQPRRRR